MSEAYYVKVDSFDEFLGVVRFDTSNKNWLSGDYKYPYIYVNSTGWMTISSDVVSGACVISSLEFLKTRYTRDNCRTPQTPSQDTDVNTLNPKAQVGSQALPMSMCSPLFAAHVALGKLNGSLKYGLSNFVGTNVVMSIYLDAIQRHLDKIKMGEVVDEVDGVNHFGAIGANCDIILSAQAAGTLIDDRALCTGQLDAYKALTPMVKNLKDLHEGKNPKHYYMKDGG